MKKCNLSQLFQLAMRSRRSDDPLSGECVSKITINFQRLIVLRFYLGDNESDLLRASLLKNFLIQNEEQKKTFFQIPETFTKAFSFKNFQHFEEKKVISFTS